MADLSDVETAITSLIGGAIYPNGIGSPSSLPGATPVRIDRGWPLPASLDADIAANICNVTVFPMPGTAEKCYQLLDVTYTIVPPAYGLTVSVSGNAITVSGQPVTGEYLTVVCDRANVYSRSVGTTSALLAALAADAQANYPSANSTATTLTIPTQFEMDVRQGGVGTLGKVIHRQKQAIMISIWAPNDAVRVAAASAIDIALKQNIKLTMPDTSQALLIYSRSNVSDDKQKAAIYRRDLIFDAEYATLQQFPGYVITSVKTSITDPTNTAIANAIT